MRRVSIKGRSAAGWAAVLGLVLGGCQKGPTPAEAPTTSTSAAPAAPAPDAPAPAPAKAAPVVRASTPPAIANPRGTSLAGRFGGELRVDSETPGFVLVDGEAVRTAEGTLQSTPLVVPVTRGKHLVTLTQVGFADQVRAVEVGLKAEVSFGASEEQGEVTPAIGGPWFDYPINRPQPLASVSSPGLETDPWLSPDGLTLLFVGDRAEGQGIYRATRPSPYHDFAAPELIRMTRGSEPLASPTGSADGLTIAYVVPSRTRVWQLSRDNPDDDFLKRSPLRYVDEPDASWLSAQLLPDGTRLYWLEFRGGEWAGRAALRAEPGLPLGKTLDFALPGRHPCLSADGLRQLSFDGTTVRRSTRATLAAAFAGDETVATLDGLDLQRKPERRNYWVSDDEQWLLVTLAENGGDLAVVRLSEGRGWGHLWVGRAAPAVEIAGRDPDMTGRDPEMTGRDPGMKGRGPGRSGEAGMEKTGEMPVAADQSSGLLSTERKEMERKERRKFVGAGAPPLPYVVYREAFEKQLGGRDLAAARASFEAARDDEELRGFAEPLGSDEADLELVEGFWKGLEDGASKLPEKTTIRVGPSRLELARVADGKLHFRTRAKEIVKPLTELTTADLLGLHALVHPDEGDAGALEVTAFLSAEPQANPQLVEKWLAKAGDAGRAYVERQARRELKVGEAELARGQVADGLERLAAAATLGAGTPVVEEATALKAGLFDRTKWAEKGPRKWGRGPDGEYSADAEASDGAWLLSPKTYRNFILECEWKVTGPAGSGGVYFDYAGQGSPSEYGYKIQLANDGRQKSVDQHSTGSLLGTEAPRKKASRPEGEWNTLRIKFIDHQVNVMINGEEVLETKVTVSKDAEDGYVALDGVNGGISYRRVILYDVPGAADLQENGNAAMEK